MESWRQHSTEFTVRVVLKTRDVLWWGCQNNKPDNRKVKDQNSFMNHNNSALNHKCILTSCMRQTRNDHCNVYLSRQQN